MTAARLDIRLDAEVKAKAEKASALLGLKSLTEYVVRLMEKDADQVIAQHETLTLKDDIFDEFIAACEQAKAPNQALRDAVAFTKEQGFE